MTKMTKPSALALKIAHEADREYGGSADRSIARMEEFVGAEIRPLVEALRQAAGALDGLRERTERWCGVGASMRQYHNIVVKPAIDAARAALARAEGR